MKDKIVRLRNGIASGQFPLYALAAVGVLMIPAGWVPPLVMAMVILHGIASPDFINENRHKFFKQPDVLRIAILGSTLWLFAFLRERALSFVSTSHAWYGPYNSIGVATSSLLGFLTVIGALLLVAMSYSVLTFPKQRTGTQYESKLQVWTGNSNLLFKAVAVAMLAVVCLPPTGVVGQIAAWFFISLRDANISNASTFEGIAATALRIGTMCLGWTLFRGRFVRAACFLTALCKQMALAPATKFGDTLVQVVRAPYTVLKIRQPHAFLKNVCASFWYLAFWYIALFYVCGFSTGELGNAISNWLFNCVRDANVFASFHFMGSADQAPPDNATLDRLRVFCAAIVALYGTVPCAVMFSSFMPYERRRELHLTIDGVVLPDSGMFAKNTYLWTNFASVDLVRKRAKKSGKLVFLFHSGEKMEIDERAFDLRSLDKLLGALDEHARNCVVSESVVALRAEIRSKISVDGKETELGKLNPQNFQSTIFVPHDLGAWLPNGEARVVRLLASRPLSCVYLVRLNSGKLAIAKQYFLSDDNEQTRALRKTFQREYELLQKIEHPRIAKILDVFDREQSTYLLIEHAAGKDLRSMVQEEGAQPESVVIDWALQVCDIMVSLHEQDPPIVHRDLTPDNMVVAEDGSVRIIDFGAAHQFMEGVTGTIIGKQSYVPPEQLQGQAGPASDVYAFGCTLHFLLTGEEPRALTQCEPKLKEKVSDEINGLVRMCTEFDDKARPQTFVEVRGLLMSMKQSRTPQEVLRKFGEAIIELRVEEEKVPVEWK